MLSRGSEWRRWEPHIHAPGTVMNNQFSGPNAWGDYLTALEQATPVIEAIAVTDYYVTDTYEEVLRHKAAGRLPSIKLVFPNVELRLDVATAKGGLRQPPPVRQPGRSRSISTSCGVCYRACSSTSCRIASIARGPISSGSARRPIPTLPTTGRAGHGANQFKVNFQQAPRGVLRKRMGEEEHPDRGGRRRDGRHVGRAGGRRSDDPARDREASPM